MGTLELKGALSVPPTWATQTHAALAPADGCRLQFPRLEAQFLFDSLFDPMR